MASRAWVATRKGLIEIEALAGGGWRVARVSFLGDPVSMLLPPPPGGGRMLAALNLGHFGCKLHASDDGGVHWTELEAPAYPAQPEGAEGPAWTLQQIWSLERDAAGRIWAGTIPGGVFRSDDDGASWRLVDALWSHPARLGWFGGGYDAPGVHSICPHPRRADDLLLGISSGGVWRSEDAGQGWRHSAAGLRADYMPPEQRDDPNIQDPHRIARCQAEPEVLWCQHHNGVWRSEDGGAHWQELRPPLSVFGFAVAAHPRDPLTAWLVPGVKDEKRVPVDGALVVNRTRDGGRSFETLRTGLPQQDCYDLVYRHGLDVDASGEHLLMGSTTGSLWASRDGGDRWAMALPHLPPIYALRFG